MQRLWYSLADAFVKNAAHTDTPTTRRCVDAVCSRRCRVTGQRSANICRGWNLLFLVAAVAAAAVICCVAAVVCRTQPGAKSR
jgi:hypothetical protein